ncbi:hypothetical protein Tco_0525934 [Tanacetum coccineum]
MLDMKLMLVDDDGKPLNKVSSDPVNLDSENDVEVAYIEKSIDFVSSLLVSTEAKASHFHVRRSGFVDGKISTSGIRAIS